MWAPIVIKADPFGDPRLGLLPIGIPLQIHILMLERSPQALDEDVVHPAAATIHRDPDSGRRQHARERGAGELASLSVLKISGRPNRAKASSSAETQNETSMVLDKRQVSTARLDQSMTATRYRKPRPIGM